MIDGEYVMKMCIEYAKQSHCPPFVGAAVVNDGEIVGFGYRQRIPLKGVEGVIRKRPDNRSILTHHAEEIALKMAGEAARGGVLYVTLEPCTYRISYGNHPKMPPCVDLIEEYGLARVVIGYKDTNPRIHMEGIKELQEKGIDVLFEGFGLDEQLRKLTIDHYAMKARQRGKIVKSDTSSRNSVGINKKAPRKERKPKPYKRKQKRSRTEIIEEAYSE